MLVFHTIKESAALTAVALGCFDGLHIGHQKVIYRAVAGHELGLSPTVFTFDASPLSDLCGKGAPRLMKNSEKLHLLEKLGIEQVYMPAFSEVRDFSAEDFVTKILDGMFHAQRVCCGFNFHFGAGGRADSEELARLCASRGIETLIVPEVDVDGLPVSSTRIRALIGEGRVEEAAGLLGRRFGYTFPVEHGRQLGRELGMPTINQRIPEGFVLPRFGVYASLVRVDGRVYCGVTNIGVKPTVGSDHVLSETWILDYGGNLYGRAIPVELVGFIRPERKFDSIDELKQAVYENAETARRMVKSARFGE